MWQGETLEFVSQNVKSPEQDYAAVNVSLILLWRLNISKVFVQSTD